MRHRGRRPRALLTIALLGALAAAAQEPPPKDAPPDDGPVVERARIVPPRSAAPAPEAPDAEAPPADPRDPLRALRPPVAERPGHHAVREVRLLKAGAGRVDGARQDDWIAFDMRGTDERYDLYVMRIEVGIETCLTCDNYVFRKVHVLDPAWHPSGEYLVVLAQGSPKRRDLSTALLTTPLRGIGSEVWVLTRDGRDAWQLTTVGERGGAVLEPHFSHESDFLVWSERLTHVAEPWGEWGLLVTEFRIRRGQPHLGKTRTYRSGIGHGLAVAHELTPDDGGLLVSAIPDRSLPQSDVVRLDLESERIERLTSTPDENDELASNVPYGDYYVWVTDRGLGDRRGRLPRRNELWLRSASGHVQERLTYFNHPRSDHYLGDAMIGDVSWTADGESLLLHVVSSPEGSGEVGEGVYLVKLGKEYRR